MKFLLKFGNSAVYKEDFKIHFVSTIAATLPSKLCLAVSIFYEGLLVLGVRMSRGGGERVLQRGALLLQGTQARKDDIYKLLYIRILFSNAS